MGDRGQREAWVTLATNDAYALGCLVLGNSLRRVGTTRQLVVMVTDGLSQSMRQQLETAFDRVVDVGLLDSQDTRNLTLLGRPDLNVTFTKIHCWKLIDYQKCVFLDADTLVIQHCDELFDREEFSAAPDAGWPDCFNSGVFVFCPSLETYDAILDYAWSRGSFDGGDQGLLNSYFSSWSTVDIMKHLPFIYNVVSQAFYSYLPAFQQFKDSIKIVHFIGPIKPWNHPYNTATRTVTVLPETGHCQLFLQMWWDLFMETVQSRLDPTMREWNYSAVCGSDQWLAMARPYILVNLSGGQSWRVLWLFVHRAHLLAHMVYRSRNLLKRVTVVTYLMEELIKEEEKKGLRHTPFIRYEHVPPSPPPPSPSSQQEAAFSFTTPPPPEDQPSSYQVLYPYVPPALDHNFYTPPHPPHPPQEEPVPHHHPSPACGSPHDGHSAASESGGEGIPQGEPVLPQMVDMPIIIRSFHSLETHYVEESLMLMDPESLPLQMYDSCHFEQKLAEETGKLKPEVVEEAAGDVAVSMVDQGEVDSGQGGAVLMGAGGDDYHLRDASSSGAGAKDSAHDDGAKEGGGGGKGALAKKRDDNSSRLKESMPAGGLVGELAQMKVGESGEGADCVVLDDRERRLAWERGHADYLGADSFDNIMKKMEEKMAPTPSSSSNSSVKKSGSSEGTPPPTTTTSLPSKPAE